MKDDKPECIADYKKWMEQELHFDLTTRITNHYNTVVSTIRNDFENSDFWHDLLLHLPDFASEYLLAFDYDLLIPNFKPELATKPYESFLHKTFRKNVLANQNWPHPPDGGWITPDNWIERINDVLRTFFVVKYLDGVEFLAEKIQSSGHTHHMQFQLSYEAREEGYYAVHLYSTQRFEVPRMTWDTEFKQISIEFQITTQLQDVITKLTHKFYERRRALVEPSSKKWQWDYKADDFLANYLGHILHYVEGMIMEVRNREREKTHAT
jgi:ppGpp synthetase/RelA/SpoT-type nucleotidyltranferase